MDLHPLALLVPPMSEEEFSELVEDVRVNGLVDPITTFEEKILDGRNRWAACMKVGVEPRTVVFDGSDPVAFVVSKNLRRRHLSRDQLETTVALLYLEQKKTDGKGRPSGAKNTASIEAVSEPRTSERLARQTGVGRSTIERRAKQYNEIAAAAPDVAEAIRTGEATIKDSHKAVFPVADVHPGDTVEDHGGEANIVTDVEWINDETLVIHSGEDALVLHPDQDVIVHWCPACRYRLKPIGEPCPQCGEVSDQPKLLDPRPTTKPDLGGGISHPARFSDGLLPLFAELLNGYRTILDPFAGTGRIHELATAGFETTGIEIEPEWAALHERTVEGNALALPFRDASFDAVCTSPTYGNRLADHHDARDGSLRRSYKHDLGRDLHPQNSGVMHWGEDYRQFHLKAWTEVTRVLRPGGRFVLNISDHIRGGVWQDVVAWHADAVWQLGFRCTAARPVMTRRLQQGENAASRVPAEIVFAFDRVEP